MKQTELIRLRNHLGWNQRQFAEYLNVTQQAVGNWMAGQRRIRGPAALLLLDMLHRLEDVPAQALDAMP